MGETTFVDKIIQAILNPILDFISIVISFILGSKFVTFIVFICIMTFLGYILMKKDKGYAENDKRRVRESTLLLVAACGGSLGIYAGMYKFKHKTLHKKFSIGVPVIMLIQVSLLVYYLFSWIF